MSHERRGYKGGAAGTTLLGDLNDSTLNIPCVDLSSWAGVNTNGTATATINAGESDEEVVEFTGISGDTLTGCTRGAGGTLAQAHSSTAAVIHSGQVKDFDEANELVAQAWTWAGWAPVYADNGSMTLATVSHFANHARYVIIGKVCTVDFSQVLTFGGTLNNLLSVSLPIAAAFARNTFAGHVQNVGAVASTADDLTKVSVLRYDGANFAAGSYHVSFAGSYEIA